MDLPLQVSRLDVDANHNNYICQNVLFTGTLLIARRMWNLSASDRLIINSEPKTSYLFL